ncbi:MAG: inositol-3-phosphate synthase [Pyrinomonadaceae bacterium]
MSKRTLGIAIVGLGGAVATTMVAGIALLKKGVIDTDGLPLADSSIRGLAAYEDIVFGGWDLYGEHLAQAAETHDVLTYKQFLAVEEDLKNIKPWPAIGNPKFVSNLTGQNVITSRSHRDSIEKVRQNLRELKTTCDAVVAINLASTEKLAEDGNEILNSLADLEKALDDDSAELSPAILYAYAAIAEGVPFGNFTPSVAADVPALIEFAERQNVPIAGKDGKTGQTFIKSVLAPALKSRALKVRGWFSTNILGNRDGLVLSNEDSLASKIKTKSSLLEDILGYEVGDHIVDIRYYKPRGDNKEAWDNIDVTGFLGQPMQIKINFLCRDSVLASPLAIEIARCLDLAKQRGEGGIQQQLSVFFKLPMTKSAKPEQAFHRQEEMLLNWLGQKHNG